MAVTDPSLVVDSGLEIGGEALTLKFDLRAKSVLLGGLDTSLPALLTRVSQDHTYVIFPDFLIYGVLGGIQHMPNARVVTKDAVIDLIDTTCKGDMAKEAELGTRIVNAIAASLPKEETQVANKPTKRSKGKKEESTPAST